MKQTHTLMFGLALVLGPTLAHAQSADTPSHDHAAHQSAEKPDKPLPRMSTNVTTAKEQAPPAETTEPTPPADAGKVKATKSRSNIQNN